MKQLKSQKLFVVVLMLCGFILVSDNVQAATYTVATTADNGAGSFRAAIAAANSSLDDDIINFSIPPSDPNCTAGGVCTIRLTTGELPVSSTSSAGKLSITNGSGANNLLLDGNKNRTDINEMWSRIFFVASGADLTLDGFTLTNGRSFGLTNTSFIGYGGGIFIEGGGKLTLLNSVVKENQGNSSGGAGFGAGIYNAGTLITSNSIINNNVLADGGGIFNAVNATVTITNSTLSGNLSVSGGGIYNSGSLTVFNADISNNSAAQDGNGIYNIGTATITFSTASANNGNGNAGIYNQNGGAITVENSTISNHSIRGVQNNGTFTMTNSTLKGNSTITNGAGIYNNNSFEIKNSTISGNMARNNGGGIYNNGTLYVTAATITNNSGSANPFITSGGGGIFNNGSGTANLFNTIVAGNFSGSSSGAPDFNGAVSAASAYNIIGNNQLTTGVTNGENGNQVGTPANSINPRLAPLGNYGGATESHALFSDSPAIDKGKSFGLLNDQLGFTRTVDSSAVTNASGGDGTDIGSVEIQAASPVSLSGLVVYGSSPVNHIKYVSGVLLTANGTFTAVADTNSSGYYFFETNLQKDEQYTVTPSKTGQVSGITSFDSALVLRCVAAGNNCNLTANQKIAADTDGDNSVTAFDATQILRYVAAGTSNANTGQVGKWKFDPASRSYPALSNSLSGENYTAFLIGDIDGDWAP